MATLLGCMVFAAFLLAQIAAVVASHADTAGGGSDAIEARRLARRLAAMRSASMRLMCPS
jgi:hypothetical protein